MVIQTISITPAGLQQIRTALASHHRLGGDHFTEDMLHAWASAAEQAWQPGEHPQVEIPGRDAIGGTPVVIFIDAAGYVIESVDE